MDPRRHEILARAFRSALEEGWRLDFDELLTIEKVANRLGHRVPHLEIATHARTTQVEVTVSETEVFVDLIPPRIIQRKWRSFRNVVNGQLIRDDFDVSSGQRLVLRAGGTVRDSTRNSDHRLRLEVLQL